MALSEFEFIRRFTQSLGANDPAVELSVGDDAAVIDVPRDHRLVVSTDTMNEGVHFFSNVAPRSLGFKLVQVNASDLAAMGAQPRWATLALSVPLLDADWMSEFRLGLHESLTTCGIALVGGDTTRGPLALTMTVMGIVPKDQQLQRSAAQVGDKVWITGALGGARFGLEQLNQHPHEEHDAVPSQWVERLLHPCAKVDVGMSLVGYCNACIDVSDGLLGDLTHILRASQVDAHIYAQQIPLDAVMHQAKYPAQQILDYGLNGGEDYELLFTQSEHQHAQWQQQYPDLAKDVTCIGAITACSSGAEAAITMQQNNERRIIKPASYEHF